MYQHSSQRKGSNGELIISKNYRSGSALPVFGEEQKNRQGSFQMSNTSSQHQKVLIKSKIYVSQFPLKPQVNHNQKTQPQLDQHMNQSQKPLVQKSKNYVTQPYLKIQEKDQRHLNLEKSTHIAHKDPNQKNGSAFFHSPISPIIKKTVDTQENVTHSIIQLNILANLNKPQNQRQEQSCFQQFKNDESQIKTRIKYFKLSEIFQDNQKIYR